MGGSGDGQGDGVGGGVKEVGGLLGGQRRLKQKRINEWTF